MDDTRIRPPQVISVERQPIHPWLVDARYGASLGAGLAAMVVAIVLVSQWSAAESLGTAWIALSAGAPILGALVGLRPGRRHDLLGRSALGGFVSSCAAALVPYVAWTIVAFPLLILISEARPSNWPETFFIFWFVIPAAVAGTVTSCLVWVGRRVHARFASACQSP